MAVTIHHLEVHLEVEGNDEEAAFTRLFNQHIRRWNRANQERVDRERLATQERRLSGPDQEDHD
jgi:hypothetical protein